MGMTRSILILVATFVLGSNLVAAENKCLGPKEDLSSLEIEECNSEDFDFLEAYGYAEEPIVPYEDVLKLCKKGVRDLSAVSETIDRVGAGADMRIQLQFSSLLKETNDCALELSERSQTGKKYSVSKDWFGNGYKLND